MLGVELVTDRQQKTPAKAEIPHVMDLMKGEPFLSMQCWGVAILFSKKGHESVDFVRSSLLQPHPDGIGF